MTSAFEHILVALGVFVTAQLSSAQQRHQPVSWFFGKSNNERFKVDVIDTWNMTITPHDKIYQKDDETPLPGKPYHAIRIRGAE